MPADSPFIRYRARLDSYRAARAFGWTDARFVQLVEELDAAVVSVAGHGFVITPLVRATIPPIGELWIKDDTVNVAGSHKGRHLFGLALHLEIQGVKRAQPLAIASCGNAALAAAVVARAAGRPLDVFVPTWANPVIVEQLRSYGAKVVTCARSEGQLGDPCYAEMRDRVRHGSIAFSCQGTDAPHTFDGGRTIAWELIDQLADENAATLDEIFVQVGGGALATSVVRGWVGELPKLFAVQAEGGAPLVRAWRRLLAAAPPDPIAYARAYADDLMEPWESEPQSAASGILDDVTYDWLGIVEGLVASGGDAIAVPEREILRANELARKHTAIDADYTATAGLAGALTRRRSGGRKNIAVLFTGKRR